MILKKPISSPELESESVGLGIGVFLGFNRLGDLLTYLVLSGIINIF